MLPFFGPVRTVQQIIAVDRQNDMESWDYKLPKKASREVALKYRRLLDSRRFCSLCKKVCLKRRQEQRSGRLWGGTQWYQGHGTMVRQSVMTKGAPPPPKNAWQNYIG